MALAVLIGLPLGVLAAVRRDSAIDRLVRLISLLGIATPFFVIAVALILLLSLRPMAYITRITRLAMLQVLGEDYIRTAKAKGLPPLRRDPGADVRRRRHRRSARSALEGAVT